MLNILVEYWLTDGDEPVPRATSDLRPASAAVYRPPSAGTLAALQVGSCCTSEQFDSDRRDIWPLLNTSSAPGFHAVHRYDALLHQGHITAVNVFCQHMPQQVPCLLAVH